CQGGRNSAHATVTTSRTPQSASSGRGTRCRMAGILRRASAPARAVQRALDPGRDRPGAPPRAVPQPPGATEPALAREARAVFVQGGVLGAEAAKCAAIPAAVGGQLGGAVPAVLECDRVHPASAPAVREGIDPQLPVLELLEGLVEA